MPTNHIRIYAIHQFCLLCQKEENQLNIHHFSTEIKSLEFIFEDLKIFKSHSCLITGQFWKAYHENWYFVRDGFKTQLPVDRRFRPVPAGFYCSKQWQLLGTGRNRRSTGSWVLKLPLILYSDNVNFQVWRLKVLKTYPITHNFFFFFFFEHDVSRLFFAGLLIMYDVLIQRLSWCF